MREEADDLMARRRNSRTLAPRPSVPNPRPHLLNAVLAFVRAAQSTPGVLRIALLGSLATDKPVPKDADVLVTIDAAMDLGPLARLGRRLQGTAQTVNLGADISHRGRPEALVADRQGRRSEVRRACERTDCLRRDAIKSLRKSAHDNP
jgi:predicted nucleotidyltransferase